MFFLNPTKTFSASILDEIFIRDNDFSSAVFFVNLPVQLTKNAVVVIVVVYMCTCLNSNMLTNCSLYSIKPDLAINVSGTGKF